MRRRNLEGKSGRFTRHQARKLRSMGYCPRSPSLIRKFEMGTAKPSCASWFDRAKILCFLSVDQPNLFFLYFLGICFYRIVGHSRNRVPGQKAQGYTFGANMSTSKLADTCSVIVILWLRVFALHLACSVCFLCSFSYLQAGCTPPAASARQAWRDTDGDGRGSAAGSCLDRVKQSVAGASPSRFRSAPIHFRAASGLDGQKLLRAWVVTTAEAGHVS